MQYHSGPAAAGQTANNESTVQTESHYQVTLRYCSEVLFGLINSNVILSSSRGEPIEEVAMFSL